MAESAKIGANRAEGIDAGNGGRVKPSAISFSREFSPKTTPPAPMSIDDMMQRAKRSGMIDGDSPAARFIFGRISYQHLCEYFDILDKPGCPLPKSMKNANAIMEVDRAFQLILLEFIGLFEMQLRNAYSVEMSRRYGAFAHRNGRLFKSEKFFDDFLARYRTVIGRKLKGPETRQRRHIVEYGDMPIWEAVEELSIGEISKLYKNTRSAGVRSSVADSFAISRELLESWLSCITVVRNQCAHFGRLLGSPLVRQPKKMDSVNADNTNPFYVALMLMRLLRTNVNFGEISLLYSAQIGRKVTSLFGCRQNEARALGVPNDWRDSISDPNVSGVLLEFRLPWEPSFDEYENTVAITQRQPYRTK